MIRRTRLAATASCIVMLLLVALQAPSSAQRGQLQPADQKPNPTVLSLERDFDVVSTEEGEFMIHNGATGKNEVQKKAYVQSSFRKPETTIYSRPAPAAAL